MEDYRQNICDMTNQELKENIINLNKYKLERIKKSSYLNGFNSIISLKSILDNEKQTEYLINISEVDLLKKYVNKAIDVINFSMTEKEEKKYIEEVLSIRKDLYELCRIIEGYFIELSYIGQIIDQYGMEKTAKSNYKEDEIKQVNIEQIIELIDKKLELSKKDYNKYTYIVSQIVYLLPMRFTKDKYFNIIKGSLTRNLNKISKSQVEDKINYYKRQWDSSLQYGYGINFGYYFTKIEKLKKIKFKEKTLEELDEIVKEVMTLTKEINELYNFILILGLTYNMIISIYLSREISISGELEEIWEKWKTTIEENDKKLTDQFLKTNKKEIEENEKKTVEFLSEFEELNIEAIKREGLIDEELNHIFLNTKKILTYYNDYNLSDLDLLLSNNGEIVPSYYLEQYIDSLIKYMTRSMSKMSNMERKIRMRKVLSLVELPFKNIREFRDYIKYSLDRKNTSEEEINFIVDYIIHFFSNMENQ